MSVDRAKAVTCGMCGNRVTPRDPGLRTSAWLKLLRDCGWVKAYGEWFCRRCEEEVAE